MNLTTCVIAAFLSSICSIVLILIWILNPKWQSLHNFISINQIIVGSLHLISINLKDILEDDSYYDADSVFVVLNGYLYLASTCWSLCASLLAYLRLVLVYTGKISYGKRKATVFSFGTLIVVKGISDFLIPFVYNLGGFYELLGSRLVTIYTLTIVNLVLFVRVVTAVILWGKSVAVRKRGKRVIALIGVAVLCDTITIIQFLCFLIPDPYNIILAIYHFRLIPHTIIVLFSKKSKDYWKKIIKQRRRRTVNSMI